MKRWLIALVVVALSSTLYAQSLGDVARVEAARRAKADAAKPAAATDPVKPAAPTKTTPAKAYTNDNLVAVAPAVAGGSPATALYTRVAERCLKLGTFGSSILSMNASFVEYAWKIDVVNSCGDAMTARVTYTFVDKDDFELHSDTENVVVAAYGRAEARGRTLVSPPEIARRITTDRARIFKN